MNQSSHNRCPIPGCNKPVRLQDCEADKPMEFKLKRYKRRLEHEREQKMSQA
eukprot:CAMPEP_0202471964 /NCGR_PEP_ID=MMETSP1360-20130828/86226_1 /ASSEMBLY_ACC=CAM_ASM_000848 /TAXON_ID=515479 /ORGANISM="Licmophora paradoxa, Strain CCMP2313" /LENGTH=51 /DNA_ID=CAMNT_0049098237 /DNA_START=41 /DNA_END=192 /DNA_ORIENTATION=+